MAWLDHDHQLDAGGVAFGHLDPLHLGVGNRDRDPEARVADRIDRDGGVGDEDRSAFGAQGRQIEGAAGAWNRGPHERRGYEECAKRHKPQVGTLHVGGG